jgi:alkanesulfonate monooxygenase SsuD/methylene tetrahydromethanopterin reductase-like flavin-dependent oxidoreductase (luciferase family)
MNEEPFFQEAGLGWPKWKQRIERLVEGVELIRRTWSSNDYFSFEGRFFKMRNILLYTKPRTRIPIYFSAMGPKAATYAGRFGDALITISTPSRCEDVIFPRFEEGARTEGKNPGSMEKMAFVCFGIGEESSLIQRLKGGDATFLAEKAFEEPDPRRVEAMAATVEDSRIRESFQLCRSVDDLVEVVESYVSVSANQVVFSTGASPELIKNIGERVIPSFH